MLKKAEIKIRISNDIKRDFKEWCKNNEYTMSEIIEIFIIDIMKEDKE